MLRNFISNELIGYYMKVKDYYKNSKNTSKEDPKMIEYKLEKITRLINSLGDTAVKNNIITEAKEIFSISHGKFLEKLDTLPYIMGFNNGVYDFEKGEFRDGKPEDLISMSCGYDFPKKYSKYKADLDKFLEDIQPEKKERDYLLTYLSSGLIGLNITELFTIFTGENGRNGKTKLVDLIENTLGNYYSSINCKLLTQPRPDATRPDPGLFNIMKKRIVIASEPEKDDKFNSGFIKLLTGGDKVPIRKCHGNDIFKFKANFITLMVCNAIPEVDKIDNAFSKRLRCLCFPTEFTHNPRLPHEKKINEKLQLELPKWKQDFMLLLIEYYNKFKNGDLKPTDKILEWTNLYKENTDIYLLFLNETTEEADTNIHISELYDVFKHWYKDNYPNEKLPNNRTFLTGIKKYKAVERSIKAGKKVSTGIKNLKIKEE